MCKMAAIVVSSPAFHHLRHKAFSVGRQSIEEIGIFQQRWLNVM
jgi:hypothetical protein